MDYNPRFTHRTLIAFALAAVAWFAGRAGAEVDVLSWGETSYDQGDVRERYAQIAAGIYHTVALKNDGTVVAWGNNSYGQCTVPADLSGVTQIAAGVYHTVVLVTFTDCNANGQRDSYEIGKNLAADTNANSRIDSCDMADGDLDLNGVIDTADLSLLILNFGPCQGCPDDFDGDGDVTTADIALLLLNFGPTG